MMTDSFTESDCNNCNGVDYQNPSVATSRKGKYRGDRGADHIKRAVHSNSLQNLKQNRLKAIAESNVILEGNGKEHSIQANEAIHANSTITNNHGKWIVIGLAVFIMCVVLWTLWSDYKKKNKIVLDDTEQSQ